METKTFNCLSEVQQQFIEQEQHREELLAERRRTQITSRLKTLIKIESKKGKRPQGLYKIKWIMTPAEYLRTTFVKISIAYLYRRYRQVRLQALSECISIAHTETDKEQLIKKIREKIIECGVVHKDTINQLKGTKVTK